MIFRVSPPRLLHAAAILLAWIAPATAHGDNDARSIAVEAITVALDPANPERRRVGGLVYRGGLELRSEDKSFGGYSGMTVSADGTRLLAISDKGTWLAATLGYRDGDLAGVTDARVAVMLDTDGRALEGQRRDAESLARDRRGGFLVGFERQHRIYRYPPVRPSFDAVPVELATPEDLSQAPYNKGLETVAFLSADRYLLLAEDYRNDELDTKGWILTTTADPDSSSAARVNFAVSGLFHPTGAATLPNGDVLVLQRRYVAVRGGSMRLRRLAHAEIVAGARLSGTTVATIAPPLTVDNMEAIAVREGPAGEILVYVMSDDNFSTGNGSLLLPSQRTLLMMFRLDDEAPD